MKKTIFLFLTICISAFLGSCSENLVNSENNKVLIVKPTYIYPNPSSDFLVFRFELKIASKSTKIKVFNEFDKEIMNLYDWALPAGLQEVQIKVSTLSSGVYYVLIDSDGEFGALPFQVIK